MSCVIQIQKVRIVRLQRFKSARTCASVRNQLLYNNWTDGQVDEVEVFGLFGGDLPVFHHTANSSTEKKQVTVFTTNR